MLLESTVDMKPCSELLLVRRASFHAVVGEELQSEGDLRISLLGLSFKLHVHGGCLQAVGTVLRWWSGTM